MRHRKKKGRLNRKTAHRKATMKLMVSDLFTYQRIETTLAKAKVLRGYAEPLITLAKNNPESVNAKRQVFRKLSDRKAVKSLFDELAPLYKDVPGGYTRIMALGNRKGDGAQMAIIELTKRTISDDDLLEKKEKTAAKKKARKAEEESAADAGKEKKHAAPEVEKEKQEERAIEDVKKEKAKKEQKKITKRGIFKRFQRKSMG